MLSCFKLKWQETCNWIVGINLTKRDDALYLDQRLLATQIVQRWSLLRSDKLIRTTTVLPITELVTGDATDGIKTYLYQLFINSLNYLALGSRPNILYTVNYLLQYNKCPALEHWEALKHII